MKCFFLPNGYLVHMDTSNRFWYHENFRYLGVIDKRKSIKIVLDLVLVKNFNVFIWIKVDGPADHGHLAI